MKRGAIERNFRKIKNQIAQIDEIVRHTKTNALWDHESAVRKKLKELKEYEDADLKDYTYVYDGYLEILEYISKRLLEDYNNKNHTSFRFEDIIRHNYDNYLKSGIITVLITNHIPEVALKEFERIFPSNPKDEYTDTRRLNRKFYLHLGDTNTGKTYNAMQRLKGAADGVYLSPLRILALENYEKLNREGTKCSLLTGEEEINVEGSRHIASTIEKLDISQQYEVGVIDEIQMINDDQRGAAWTRALLGLKCKEIHICGAMNAKEVIVKILKDCNEEYEIIEYTRSIPLEVIDKSFSIKDIQSGDALVVFSKKRVLELAYSYSEQGIKSSLIYGDLPPEVRKKQYEQFINKETSILITTDAIGMGVNLPIRRIIFMDMKKFDGSEVRFLNSQEVKQIAGRAGRKGIYDIGYVGTYGDNLDFIRENLEMEDYPIRQAVLGPSEEILRIKNLPLREKLALWSTMEPKVPYYKKMDVSEYIVLLDTIKGYRLDEKIQWKLLRIPFDVSNSDIMETFLFFIDELFVAKSKTISKPQCLLKDLYEFERYYQKINLYYSFSKAFGLEFDEKWVYEERINVSNSINIILKDI